jgi:hypothetical protein
MYMGNNLPTSNYMGLMENLSFFPILRVTNILLLKFVDSTSPGILSFIRK